MQVRVKSIDKYDSSYSITISYIQNISVTETVNAMCDEHRTVRTRETSNLVYLVRCVSVLVSCWMSEV